MKTPQPKPKKLECPCDDALMTVRRRSTSSSLHSKFITQATLTPEKLAVMDGETSLTYGHLDRASDAIAVTLRREGALPGSLVGLSLRRGAHVVSAILGILKAGCGYVPLDPAYPESRLSFMAADAGLSVILTEGDIMRAGWLAGTVRQRFSALDLDGVGATVDVPRAPVIPDVDASGVAYVIYTSGSTGVPKGVPITHANLSALFDSARQLFDFTAADIWSMFHSYAFDFSVWEMWGALLNGGSLVVPSEEIVQSPNSFLAFLLEKNVTVLNQVPSVFAHLVEVFEELGAPGHRLRYIIFGGEALDGRATQRWIEANHGDESPILVNMYGITEITIHATYRRIQAADLPRLGPATPIGFALPHLELELLDDSGSPVSPGEIGEIYITGPSVSTGYINRPELTAQRFIQRPDDPIQGRRWYKSGDLARQATSREFEFVGRNDDQVKIRGYRIELAEIERVYLESPRIRQFAVAAVRSPRAEPMLVGFYVSVDRDPALNADLRQYGSKHLPSHMVPSRFVCLDKMPLTPSGKLDRRQMATDAGLEPA
jgi:amino acid adenylation domain-containing protein